METAVSFNSEITAISNSNFREMVLESEEPVLLMCASRDQGGAEQTRIMLKAVGNFHKAIDVCRLEEDFIHGFKQMYKIKGTPVFLLFEKGHLRGRMLGMADTERLEAFLVQVLPPNEKNLL